MVVSSRDTPHKHSSLEHTGSIEKTKLAEKKDASAQLVSNTSNPISFDQGKGKKESTTTNALSHPIITAKTKADGGSGGDYGDNDDDGDNDIGHHDNIDDASIKTASISTGSSHSATNLDCKTAAEVEDDLVRYQIVQSSCHTNVKENSHGLAVGLSIADNKQKTDTQPLLDTGYPGCHILLASNKNNINVPEVKNKERMSSFRVYSIPSYNTSTRYDFLIAQLDGTLYCTDIGLDIRD